LREQVQEAEALWRGMHRTLAGYLAGGAQRVAVRGGWRWPDRFGALALGSRKRIGDGVPMQFRNEE